MNFTLISAILAALPDIIAVVEEILSKGGSASDAHNAVQGHPLIANAHPDIRATMHTIVAHVINEHQEGAAAKAEAAAVPPEQPEQQPPSPPSLR